MIKTDFDMTKEIINSFEKLKIDDIVMYLDDKPTEHTEVEFYPLIDEAKHVLERTLSAAVLLGGFVNEEQIPIRRQADMELASQIFDKLTTKLSRLKLTTENRIKFDRNARFYFYWKRVFNRTYRYNCTSWK